MSASTYQAPFDAALGQQEMERTFCHLAALHGANQKSGFIHRFIDFIPQLQLLFFRGMSSKTA
jgi:hypothetical protein